MFAAEIYRRISEDLKLPSKNGTTSRHYESKYRAKLCLKQVSHFTICDKALEESENSLAQNEYTQIDFTAHINRQKQRRDSKVFPTTSQTAESPLLNRS